jgi:tetratricopeptide (TPR) repeat protein
VREAIERITAQHPELIVHRAGCHEQYDLGHPYLVFNDLFSGIFTEQGELVNDDLAVAVLKETAGDWLAVVPVVGNLIGAVAKSARAYSKMTSQVGGGETDARQDVIRGFEQVLRRLAVDAPRLIFLDDLHWADAASVTALGYLARKITDAPVFFIGTYRPADAKRSNPALINLLRELRRYKLLEDMELGGLEEEAVRELLASASDIENSERSVERLTRHSGGNPLFALELGRMGKVLDATELPSSVEAVFERRIERLEEGLQRALSYASVEGDEFLSIVLARLLEENEPELEERLAVLEEMHGLVVETGEEQLPGRRETCRYRFTHGLFQQRLYSQLRRSRRRMLHRAVAETLEELHPSEEDRNAVAHKLIHHWSQAGESDRAWEYAWPEILRLRDLALVEDVLAMCSLGARLLEHVEAGEDDLRRFDLLLMSASCHLGLEHRDAGLADLERARGMLEGVEEPARNAQLLLVDAQAALEENEEVALAQRALEIARGLKDPDLLLMAMEARLDSSLSDTDELFQEFRDLLESPDLKPARKLNCLLTVVAHLAIRGEAEESDLLLEKADALAAEVESADLSGALAFTRGTVLFFQGHFAEAKEQLIRSIELVSTPDLKRTSQDLIVMVESFRGNLNGVLAARRSLLASVPDWDRAGRVKTHLEIVETLIALEQYLEAWGELETVRTIAAEGANGGLQSDVLKIEADLLMAEGNLESALEKMRLSHELARESEDWDRYRHDELAEILVALGRVADAELEDEAGQELLPHLGELERRGNLLARCNIREALGADEGSLKFQLEKHQMLRESRLLREVQAAMCPVLIMKFCGLGKDREAERFLKELEEDVEQGSRIDEVVSAWMTMARYELLWWQGEREDARTLLHSLKDGPALRKDGSLFQYWTNQCMEVSGIADSSADSVGFADMMEVQAEALERIKRLNQPAAVCDALCLSARLLQIYERFEEAREALQEAVVFCPVDTLPDKLVAIAHELVEFEAVHGTPEAVDSAIRLVEENARPEYRTRDLAIAHGYVADGLASREDWEGYLEWSDRHVGIWLDAGEVAPAVRILLVVGQVLDGREFHSDAGPYFERAAGLAAEDSDLKREVVAEWSTHLRFVGEVDRALEMARKDLEDNPAPTAPGRALQHVTLAGLLTFSNQDVEALPHYEQALTDSRGMHINWRATTHSCVGNGHWYLGDSKTAFEHWRASLQTALRSADQSLLFDVANRALERLEESPDVSGEEDLHILRTVLEADVDRRWNLLDADPSWHLRHAMALMWRDPEDARIRELESAFGAAEDTLEAATALGVLRDFGTMASHRDDFEAVFSFNERTASLLERHECPDLWAGERLNQAERYLQGGKLEHAYQLLEFVGKIIGEDEEIAAAEGLSMDMRAAELAMMIQEWEEARDLFTRLADWAGENPDYLSMESWARYHRSLVAFQTGDTGSALREATWAHEISLSSRQLPFDVVNGFALVADRCGDTMLGQQLWEVGQRYTEQFSYQSSIGFQSEVTRGWRELWKGTPPDVHWLRELKESCTAARRPDLACTCTLLEAAIAEADGRAQDAAEKTREAVAEASAHWTLLEFTMTWIPLLDGLVGETLDAALTERFQEEEQHTSDD